jgi:hypothetical protein
MHAIRHMQPLAVPKIYWIGSTWYAMETVKESLGPPTGIRKWNWQKAEAIMKLYWYLPERWFYPKAYTFNATRLLNYIEERGWIRRLAIPSIKELRAGYGHASSLTHGDLTNENTVIDLQGNYKLVDWQAARHSYIPAHRDVDYGKLIQSLLGWTDAARQGWNEENVQEIQEILRIAPMAAFWAEIHFMRIEARATETWQKDLCAVQIDYLDWLREKENVT